MSEVLGGARSKGMRLFQRSAAATVYQVRQLQLILHTGPAPSTSKLCARARDSNTHKHANAEF